jgi:hypothetical protein
VVTFEQKADQLPDSDRMLYVRGSSGFAGFARGVMDRAFIEDFHEKGKALLGSRWTEWGTEQIASNYAIANMPGSLPLTAPKYMNYEAQPTIPAEASVIHFLGFCRFDHGFLAGMANAEIRQLQSSGRAVVSPAR